MAEELFTAEVAWDAVHLCPYCKFFPGTEDQRAEDHVYGGVPGNECDFLIEDLLNEEGGIEWFVDEVAPLTNAFFVSECKHYKRLFIDFDEYMKSSMWREKREQILKRDGYKCTFCGTAKNLRVHHITYVNIPYEKDEDLITVCDKCHKKLHRIDIARKKQ